MILRMQANILAWANTQRGRLTLRFAVRLLGVALVLAAALLRPWTAPWLVAVWALVRAADMVRSFRWLRRIVANQERERAMKRNPEGWPDGGSCGACESGDLVWDPTQGVLPCSFCGMARCRVWIGAELVWGDQVAPRKVRLLNRPLDEAHSAGDVVAVVPGESPGVYVLAGEGDDDATDSTEHPVSDAGGDVASRRRSDGADRRVGEAAAPPTPHGTPGGLAFDIFGGEAHRLLPRQPPTTDAGAVTGESAPPASASCRQAAPGVVVGAAVGEGGPDRRIRVVVAGVGSRVMSDAEAARALDTAQMERARKTGP